MFFTVFFNTLKRFFNRFFSAHPLIPPRSLLEITVQAMEEELGMTRVVCEELLSRGKKSFVRQRVEAAGPRAMDDPSSARALRECATSLGVSLR